MPGGPRGLQNRCRQVILAEVGSIPSLSVIFNLWMDRVVIDLTYCLLLLLFKHWILKSLFLVGAG